MGDLERPLNRSRSRAGAALRASALQRVDQVLALCEPSLKGAHEVHDLRVAARRLLAVLAALKSRLPRRRRRALRSGLRELLHRLARIRDWDVFMESVKGERSSRARAAGHRRAALRKARRWLAGARAGRLRRHLLSLRRAVRRHALWQDGGAQWRAIARGRLRRRDRQLRQQIARARGGDPDELHRLRIQARKLRYTMEFFRPALPAASVRAIVTLRSEQARLGAVHDAWMERQLCRQLGIAPQGTPAQRARLATAGAKKSVECLTALLAPGAFG